MHNFSLYMYFCMDTNIKVSVAKYYHNMQGCPQTKCKRMVYTDNISGDNLPSTAKKWSALLVVTIVISYYNVYTNVQSAYSWAKP